jgi:hypothetical protein
MLQPAQFFGSLAETMHVPPQHEPMPASIIRQFSPGVQTVWMQREFSQVSSLAQTRSQPPQCEWLVVVLTHCPLHTVPLHPPPPPPVAVLPPPELDEPPPELEAPPPELESPPPLLDEPPPELESPPPCPPPVLTSQTPPG